MLQTWLKNFAEESCLADCYYYISRNGNIRKDDFLKWLSIGIERGDILDDGYVKNANNIMKGLVYISKVNNTDRPQIARFYNPRTGYSHFVIAKPDGEVIWDPLTDSITVKEGFIKDWRIVEQ